MKGRIPVAALGAVLLLAGSAHAQRVDHLGNMGVAVSAGGEIVLVDALFGAGLPDYFAVPAATRDSLEAAQGRFSGVVAILVTHGHADHFDVDAVAGHLIRNPRAHLVAPSVVATALETRLGHDFERLSARVHSVTLDAGQRRVVEIGGWTVTALGVVHTSPRNAALPHLGYVIDRGGWRVLHLGDALATIDNFAPLALAGSIDCAVVPFWFATDATGRRVLADHIGAETLVAVHLPTADTEGWAGRISAAVPSIVVWGDPR